MCILHQWVDDGVNDDYESNGGGYAADFDGDVRKGQNDVDGYDNDIGRGDDDDDRGNDDIDVDIIRMIE